MSGGTGSKLTALASGQWGLLSTAQAGAVGVPRSTIMRRERSGSLERLRHGVYRLAGSPAHRLDDIRAAWIASDPRTPAWERIADPHVVVGGAAAAWVHEIGDLYPSPYLLYSVGRRQTSQDDVRYRSRHLHAADVTVVDGLPVTTRERTIADLLDVADLSLVADALRDAERASTDLDLQVLMVHLDGHARRLGYSSGSELYAALRTRAGVDADRLRELLQNTDLTERLNASISVQLQRALSPLQSELGESLRAALAPLQQELTHQAQSALTAPVGRDQLWAAITGLPRVHLPESALPQITLNASSQALLHELAKRLQHPSERTGPSDTDAGDRSDRERARHGDVT